MERQLIFYFDRSNSPNISFQDGMSASILKGLHSDVSISERGERSRSLIESKELLSSILISSSVGEIEGENAVSKKELRKERTVAKRKNQTGGKPKSLQFKQRPSTTQSYSSRGDNVRSGDGGRVQSNIKRPSSIQKKASF